MHEGGLHRAVCAVLRVLSRAREDGRARDAAVRQVLALCEVGEGLIVRVGAVVVRRDRLGVGRGTA